MAEVVLHPFLQYALLAVGMALCMYLFGTLHREVRESEARQFGEFGRLKEDMKQVRSHLEELRFEMQRRDAESEQRVTTPAPPARQGLNLNKRTQALRLHRRGESPEQIAGTLGLSLSEVALLLKMQHAFSATESLASLDAGVRRSGVSMGPSSVVA
jgi:hypothetical protein